eukprot:scaffold4027_cov245-Pinguiococcus_pyrenoidosus.AAC.3
MHAHEKSYDAGGNALRTYVDLELLHRVQKPAALVEQRAHLLQPHAEQLQRHETQVSIQRHSAAPVKRAGVQVAGALLEVAELHADGAWPVELVFRDVVL